MKTTDLIPIILYQLVDSDKYGYEIIKQIESVSNGSITIKQPSLYSILKKLEQGKFISSYWQDSEIGGKRHYYKLTDNGRAQLDTYPPLEELIKDESSPALPELEEDINLHADNSQSTQISTENFEDELELTPSPINLQSTEPVAQFSYNNESYSSDIDFDSSIDYTKLKTETNLDNQVVVEDLSDDQLDNVVDGVDENIEIKPINILSDLYTFNQDVEVNVEEENQITNSFVTNIDSAEYTQILDSADDPSSIGKDDEELSPTALISNSQTEKTSSAFVEKVEPVYTTYDNKLESKVSTISDELFDTKAKEPNYAPVVVDNIEQIKYINYVDFSTDKSTIKRRKALKLHITKMLMTCSTLLIMMLVGIIVASNYGSNPLFYLSVGVASLVVVFYPIILLYRRLALRFKYSTNTFKYQPLMDFLIKFTSFLILGILIFAYNLKSLNSVDVVFSTQNLSNFVVPIAFSACLLIDFVYSFILYKPYSSKK